MDTPTLRPPTTEVPSTLFTLLDRVTGPKISFLSAQAEVCVCGVPGDMHRKVFVRSVSNPGKGHHWPLNVP